MSYHSESSNLSHDVIKQKMQLSQISLHELQLQLMSKQELRLKYIQLMNEAQKTLGRNEALSLIRESKLIWEKLNT